MSDYLLGCDILGGLGADLGSAPPLPGVRAGTATIRRGAKGNAVSYVQALVNTIVDGDYGPATEKAVIAFQLTRGIGATGVVDQATIAALDGLAGRRENGASAVAKTNPFGAARDPYAVLLPPADRPAAVAKTEQGADISSGGFKAWLDKPAIGSAKVWQVGVVAAVTTALGGLTALAIRR